MSPSGPIESAWRCKVCGYIHRGSSAPDVCPLCGAPASEFEPYQADDVPAVSGPAPEQWRCLNCNYVHQGSEPPDTCPVCAASSDRFQALGDAQVDLGGEGTVGDVLVLGAGIAGLSAVEALRTAAPNARITLVSKETELPYYRLNLTRLLAGEIDEQALPVHPRGWYEDRGIRLECGSEVAAFDPQAGQASLHGGETFPFEKMILTTGAHAFIPPIPGAARECVTGLRSVADAKCILDEIKGGARVIVIGGGVLGLEAAGALVRRDCEVTLVESFGWLLPRQLNQRAGAKLQRHVETTGISLSAGVATQEIIGDERARAVALKDGALLDCDLVVVATGIRPNSYLARRAALKVSQGVVVDGRMQTSHPDVFAAGDVAEHQGTIYGIWAPSMYQGRIAGMNAAGQVAEFGGIPRSNTLKVLGYDLFSIGQVIVEDGSYKEYDLETDEAYMRFVFRDGLMCGGILMGDASLTATLKAAIEERWDFSGLLSGGPTTEHLVDHLLERKGAKTA